MQTIVQVEEPTINNVTALNLKQMLSKDLNKSLTTKAKAVK